MTTADAALEPIRRAITVQAPVEEAFRTFTEGIGSWWPVHTHSIGVMQDGSGAPVDVVLEPRVDGDLGEVAPDGSRKSWGRVLLWEPPHRLVLLWNPAARAPTEVEVRFVAEGDATRVELEHRGWERYEAGAVEARRSYVEGWPYVLGCYAGAASSGSISR
jgi:uncharacterized protein YndB with AHSA1/START domain